MELCAESIIVCRKRDMESVYLLDSSSVFSLNTEGRTSCGAFVMFVRVTASSFYSQDVVAVGVKSSAADHGRLH